MSRNQKEDLEGIVARRNLSSGIVDAYNASIMNPASPMHCFQYENWFGGHECLMHTLDIIMSAEVAYGLDPVEEQPFPEWFDERMTREGTGFLAQVKVWLDDAIASGTVSKNDLECGDSIRSFRNGYGVLCEAVSDWQSRKAA